MPGLISQKARELATMSKDELATRAAAMGQALKRVRDKAKAPLKQFAGTAAGWGGGAVSGLVHYYLPEVAGVPVDGAVGVLISLGALMGAGDSLADTSAVFGVGLASPAISRGVDGGMRTWKAKSAQK